MDCQSERLIFGPGSLSGVSHDVDDDDAIDYLFGRGRLSLDGEGNLKVPKPKPLELDECDHRHMYRARVLEGDLHLVLAAPILWELVVESRGVDARGGLKF